MVKWSRIARNDLKAIHDYIALDSLFYAKKSVKDLIERVQSISKFPEVGRVVPELDDEKIREIFVYSYRVIYQISNKDIMVLTVVHGHRNLQPDDIPIS